MSNNDETLHDTHLYDPERHDNQIVAVFADRAAAEQARSNLTAGGISADVIEIVDQPDAAPAAKPDEHSVGDQILTGFMSLFTGHDDHGDYAHAVTQGHAVIVVTPRADTDRHQVITLLEQSHPIDFDAKLEEWRQSGYGRDARPDVEPVAGERRAGQREPTTSTSRVRSYLTDRG